MIGVDVGGTRIKIARVRDAEILDSCSFATDPSRAASDLLCDIADRVRDFEPTPESVGFAIPGEVDSKGRCTRLPNIPGFEGIEIQAELSALLQCPVCVENDGTTAAMAEQLFGHGRTHPSFLMVTQGTGIGGGVVLGGVLRRGTHGFAGELGHIALHRNESWTCGCGENGCLEAYAGTAGLLRKFRELGGRASEVRDIAVSARAGDAAGRGVFEMMGEVLGMGIRSMQNMLDVDAIVFTGGVSKSFDLIEPSCRNTLANHSYAASLAQVPLLVSELGDRAGAVGAAHLPNWLARLESPA
jgi:glucokinase